VILIEFVMMTLGDVRIIVVIGSDAKTQHKKVESVALTGLLTNFFWLRAILTKLTQDESINEFQLAGSYNATSGQGNPSFAKIFKSRGSAKHSSVPRTNR